MDNFFFKISKIFLWLVPLMIFVVSASTLFPFIVSKYIWFRTAVDLALIFFVLGLLFSPYGGSAEGRQDKVSAVFNSFISLFKKPLVIAVCVFVLMFLLACVFGVDPARSFWSNFERGEGGLQMLHLFVFFYSFADFTQRRKGLANAFCFYFYRRFGHGALRRLGWF